MHDTFVVINGVRYITAPRHVQHQRYVFNGTAYKNEEEKWMAQLLTTMGIRFLYEVQFILPDGRAFCPDFILEKPFRWIDRRFYNGSVIVGIEMKACDVYRKEHWVDKSMALIHRRHIPVLVFSRKQLKWYRRIGHLPLKQLARAA